MSTAPDIDRLRVSLASQSLCGLSSGRWVARYAVSTASRGHGQRYGSEQTPLGAHVVRVKIGAGLPRGAVFVGRRPTGEVWSAKLHAMFPDRDWVLSRILWLGGTEGGINRYGDVDTLRRFIYIHGTPDCVPVGEPASHGCVRMRNDDIIELFERVRTGARVDIVAAADA